MQYTLDHIVLKADNVDAMIEFYSKVLLLTPEQLNEYHNKAVPFPSVRINSQTVIDLLPESYENNHHTEDLVHNNLDHFCLAMNKSTWEKLVDRLELNDIEIEEGPVSRWGAKGQGTSIYFRDPEQNLIEARHYE